MCVVEPKSVFRKNKFVVKPIHSSLRLESNIHKLSDTIFCLNRLRLNLIYDTCILVILKQFTVVIKFRSGRSLDLFVLTGVLVFNKRNEE